MDRIEALEIRISQLEAQVSQLGGELSIKTDSDKVISTINTSPEGIKISGNKIHINGETLQDN